MREKLAQTTVNHPFVLKLVNTYKNAKKLYLLSEFVHGGELYHRIHPPDGGRSRLDELDARFYAASVTLALSGAYLLTGAALLLAGGAWVVALSMFNVTIQLSTPRWVVGRALALYQTGTFGGMAAGSWIAGLLAEAHGVDAAMLVAAAAMCLGAAAGRILPLPAFGVLDLDPLDRFREPPLRLDLTRRSGPIMVTVDYIIAQADVPAFLSVMALRRRIRLRDGARQWTLLRDLENPDVWTESYHVPTWVEYVRHNARRTQADLDGYERLLALHRGDAPPKVRRMIERQTVPLHDDTPLKPPA